MCGGGESELGQVITGILELDNSDDCVEPTRERRQICKRRLSNSSSALGATGVLGH